MSAASGIAGLSRGYGHGVTVGDFDNDGHPDLFLTRWRAYVLYRNRGDGTFEDVTERAGWEATATGRRPPPSPTSMTTATSTCMSAITWSGTPSTRRCASGPQWPREASASSPARTTTTARPGRFPPWPDHLFRNDGGRFVDVTAEAGIIDRDGRGLGVVAADLDDDGRVDLFVANDTTANYLWHNNGGMRFEELGTSAGVACNAAGAFQAGMGTAVGDLDGDGNPDLFVTNFYGESTTFFRNMGGGMFGDQTGPVGLAGPTRFLLGFGIAIAGRQQRRPPRPGHRQRPRQRRSPRLSVRDAGLAADRRRTMVV